MTDNDSCKNTDLKEQIIPAPSAGPAVPPVSAGGDTAQMPGGNGRGAIFTCPECGARFAKTGLSCPFCQTKLWDR